MNLKIISMAALTMVAGCTSTTLVQEASGLQSDVLAHATAMNSDIVSKQPASTIRGTSQYADALATEQLKMPVMRRAHSTYIGSRMVPVTSDDKLPSIFRQEYTFDADDRRVGRAVSLGAIANRIFNSTGLPVRIQPDVDGVFANGTPGGAKANGAAAAPVEQQAAPAAVPLSIDTADLRYSGPLVGFLNRLTDRLGLAWEYRDGSIVIMRFVTEAHEVSAFIGKTAYAMKSGANSSAQTTGSQSTDTRLTVDDMGEMDAFGTLEATVKKMIASVPGSDLIRADGSKKLIVKTSREMQAQVRDFIAAENVTMQKQALIQFDIYSVQTNDQDERGLNWDVVLNSLCNVYGVNMISPTTLTGTNAAQVGISILKGDSNTSKRFADSTAIVNMLNEVGSSVQHRIVPMIAMNGTWARKSRLSTESYIAETTPGASSAVGAGAPGIKTDKVTTGDQYQVLPQILNNNSIMLKMGISLSDLLGLTDQTSGVGINQQKVQTTKVSATNEQANILIRPGEVMSITGLSRLVSTGDQRSLAQGVSIFAGGSRKVGVVREHFIIFVRPVVL